MARPNPIRRIMELELPSLAYQRTKQFRPSMEDIKYAYNILNKYIFDNELTTPKIDAGIMRNTWAWCMGHYKEQETGSWTQMRISDKWYCPQWFMNTLAHEMIHQYQWDIYSIDRISEGVEGIMSHGPSYFMWKERFEHYGLNIKVYHRSTNWFQYQDFSKC